KNLYLTKRFFIAGGVAVVLFIFSFAFEPLLLLSKLTLAAFAAFFITDLFLLFNPSIAVNCSRITPRMISLGDENEIGISIENKSRLPLKVELVDEIPEQFQKRNFGLKFRLDAADKKKFHYSLRPVARGEYIFENINIYLSSVIGLTQRRMVF